jgi:hypothetical protein
MRRLLMQIEGSAEQDLRALSVFVRKEERERERESMHSSPSRRLSKYGEEDKHLNHQCLTII